MANLSELVGTFIQNTIAPGHRGRPPQEQAYLADLAKKTGLNATVVQNIHQTLGVKV